MSNLTASQTPVIILAGGKGTRIASVNSDVPKALLKIADRPFLRILLEKLAKDGFRKIYLSTHHLSEKIEQFIAETRFENLEIKIFREERPLGTGGAIKNVMKLTDDGHYLVLNGDTYVDYNYSHLINEKNLPFSIGISFIKEPNRYHCLEIDKEGLVYGSSLEERDEAFINNGIYLLSKSFIDHSPEDCFSFEQDSLKSLAGKQLLNSFKVPGPFIDIGVPEALEKANKLIPHWEAQEARPCLFLDRDGIIIEDHQYVCEPERVEFVPGIPALIKWAKARNMWVIVLTNQAGIGRGKFSEETYKKFEFYLDQQLRERAIPVDAWYHCPFHATKGLGVYKKLSLSRKPKPGMLMQAFQDFPIDPKGSLMVGDKESDILEFAGIEYYLIQGIYPIDQAKFKNILYPDLNSLLSYLQDRP